MALRGGIAGGESGYPPAPHPPGGHPEGDLAGCSDQHWRHAESVHAGGRRGWSRRGEPATPVQPGPRASAGEAALSADPPAPHHVDRFSFPDSHDAI
jgi:hypothetical protein